MGRLSMGIVGCGVMGGHAALRMAAAGYAVSAWNRTRGKAGALADHGIAVCRTPSEALDGRDVVLSFLTDGPAIDAILFEADDTGRIPASCLKKDGIVLVMSTISRHEALAQEERSRGLGLHYVDAPVSGGEQGARDGTLTIMVGGETAVVERLEPVFKVLGKAAHMGPVGAGTVAKLASQNIVAITLCAVSEALLFAEQAGADPAAVRQALLGGFAQSAILRQHGERMIKADWKPGGVAVNQVKDQKALLRIAEELRLDLPFARMALAVFRDLCDHGDGQLDHSAVYREIQRRCGLPPR